MEKNSDYKSLTDKHNKNSPILKRCTLSFFGGGALCLIGEVLSYIYIYVGASEEEVYLLVTLTYIFLGALLTAVGIFDKITGYIFAGALVPVTGFSNAVVSEAMDASYEGYVLGVGAKIFTVAGPVILFGLFSGVIYGVIYFITMAFL